MKFTYVEIFLQRNKALRESLLPNAHITLPYHNHIITFSILHHSPQPHTNTSIMKLLLSLLISAGPTMAMDFELPEADISATSKIGSRILSKARMLEGDNDQAYTSWVAGYSIKFDKCVSSANYYGGYFAENGDNADANYYYDGAADANEYNYNQDAEQQDAEQQDAEQQDAEQQDAEQQDAEQQDAEQQNAQAYNYNGNRRLEQNQGYYGNEADAERQDYNGTFVCTC